jgi:hypothetical protein
VSLDRIDARFLLPRRPRTALVLGDLPHWRAGLPQADIKVVERGRPADLAVASHAFTREAVASGCPLLLVEGGRVGGATFFAVPRAASARLLLPLRKPQVARYALRRFEGPTAPATRLRNAIAAAAVGRGLVPGRFVVGVGGTAGPPFILRAAAETGAVPADPDWFMSAGQGDALSRGVFVLFVRGEERPTSVIKFARVTGYAEPFERDERGLELVRRAGEAVAAHAPELTARFAAEEIECSVERAAVGERLYAVLQEPTPRAAREQLVDAVAEWLIDVEVATRSQGAGPDIEHLASEWDVGAEELRLPDGIPRVLQHNDPGTWNVVVDGSDFTLLDWEDAEPDGLPLGDLWYFLGDALAHLDGVATEARADYFVRLFRGELPASQLVFARTRLAVERLGVPEEAVGKLATLCWLRHGSADRERRLAASELEGTALAPLDFAELTRRWLTEPGLGPRWNSWAQPRT